MRAGRNTRFTVFDVMESKGLFDLNEANMSSPQYKGPIEYPKMYYHPLGKTRVTQKAEILQTAFGPQKVGEQFEIISRVANDAGEAAKLEEQGWHDHPAKAIAASGGKAPAMTSRSGIADLERQLAIIQAQLSAAKANPPGPEVDEDGELVEDEDLTPPVKVASR